MFSALEQVSIIIPIAPGETAHHRLLESLKPLSSEIIVSSEGSRAKSLNAGAARAQKPFLWFLHADTSLNKENFIALELALKREPNNLHYFDLSYTEGGLASLNAHGANIRSRLFGLPYGDQGFCISQHLFDTIGGYPENTPWGEDLLFVRLAKKKGINLHRIRSKLNTSARKYQQQGWLRLTIFRQWQLMQLMRQKI